MRRLSVPADNNCLFTSVGYLLRGKRRDQAMDLRDLVATFVLTDPVKWNRVVLEKEPEEYAAWVRDPKRWGGGIELTLLASHFQCEFSAVMVNTQRVFTFGTGAGYTRRAYLVWDGIHYDPIVRDPSGRGDEREYVTTVAPDDEEAERSAVAIAREMHRKRQFTSMGEIVLVCLDDNTIHHGQAAAVAHAKRTGFANFAEYKG